jgi:hypothetical protein
MLYGGIATSVSMRQARLDAYVVKLIDSGGFVAG